MYNRRFTPEKIQTLNQNEIFVFGSNLAGAHGGGAARIAVNCFGAIWGQGVGLQGQCYAIPTMHGGVEAIQPFVDEFIEFAKRHTKLTFLVTRIGCGIAGFKDRDIAPLFKEALKIENIILPKSFVDCITKHRISDYIRGCLMAGAAGDALGYEVEFMSRGAILSRFGEQGITKFALDSKGNALISDDTQMTLFTANGMLMGLTRGYMRGIGGRPETYVDGAYIDWYYTQTKNPKARLKHTWLCDLPEMAKLRAPGNTCLNACESMLRGEQVVNKSKGCGGIMRVAPMALLIAGYTSRGKTTYSIVELAEAGGEIAECTHKHPLGFLPASLLTVLLYKVLPMSPKQVRMEIDRIVAETLNILDTIYQDKYANEKRYLKELTEIAVRMAHSDISDADAIRQIGEGWVAEETWAIALFCAIRHIDSVEDAIIASVNHDGDSDSTGSVCGNIMGAIYGYEYIKERNIFCSKDCKLEDTLELSEIILAIANDLSTGCIISEYNPIDTPEKRQWYDRYCEMKPAGIKCQ
ncbi:MAG: ADP-ribosylglycohydrolase family protein [Muribaculaceae bacterium]|nr:ADP-ribosylglycohydrolase family protein [Muribaculaceae bacterium]